MEFLRLSGNVMVDVWLIKLLMLIMGMLFVSMLISFCLGFLMLEMHRYSMRAMISRGTRDFDNKVHQKLTPFVNTKESRQSKDNFYYERYPMGAGGTDIRNINSASGENDGGSVL